MKKVLLFVLLALVLSTAVVTVACAKKPQVDYQQLSQQKVLFLGDSIAEGIAGPSPLEQRNNYAYYGILGQINGYTYNNRAISGNLTGDFLSYIMRDDCDAYVTNTLIREADIICISISGNDMLFSNFPHILYEFAANEYYGDTFVDQPLVQQSYCYKRHGTVQLADGNYVDATPGSGITNYYRVLNQVKTNMAKILARLRVLNPNAHIFFQNVYNPVDDESEMIPTDLVEDLMKIDVKYDFSRPKGVAEYRRWGAFLLNGLSDSVRDSIDLVADERIHFVDVAADFDALYNTDTQRGKDLIFVDGVHPSDQGHARIAALLQQKFVDLGLAHPTTPIENYKQLRLDQLKTMYPSIDLQQARAAFDTCHTLNDISNAYFDMVASFTPVLAADPVKGHVTNGVAVKETLDCDLSRVILGKADQKTQDTVDGYLGLALYGVEEAHLVVNTDNTLSMRITLPLGDVLSFLGDSTLDGVVIGGLEDNCYCDQNGNLINLKLSGALDTFTSIVRYANALFPGIDFTGGNCGRNFMMMYQSLGIGFEGFEALLATPYIDYDGLPVDGGSVNDIDQKTIGLTYNSYLDYVIAYLGRYTEVIDAEGKTLHVDRLPEGIQRQLGLLENVTIKWDAAYSYVEVPSADGTVYKALYVGDYNEHTSPWCILTLFDDAKGKQHIKLYFAMADISVIF